MDLSPESSRIAKILIETGLANFTQAEGKLRELKLRIHLSEKDVPSVSAHAAALTAIATASRCFLGGVALSGAFEQKLLLPLDFRTIGEAARFYGAKLECEYSPTVIIGSGMPPLSNWSVRTWWNSWIAGVRPIADNLSCGKGENPLTGAASGSLAVSHAFRAALGDPRAGLSAELISLWNPASQDDPGESRVYIPKSLWLVGLGNLGQAYLWCLGLLPVKRASDISLLLQDFDIVKAENWGTSILTQKQNYGLLKTRIAEDWAMARGFKITRYDRRFDAQVRRDQFEPAYALVGLDKMEPRKTLGNAGFEYIIDAGLGASADEYHRFRVNIFDKTYSPEKHFSELPDEDESRRAEKNLMLPGYQTEMEKASADACGIAEIAGANAAVPFVSAFVATLVIAQAIRLASGIPFCRTISGSINDIGDIRASMADSGQHAGIFSESITI
jgi:hypothetical protein